MATHERKPKASWLLTGSACNQLLEAHSRIVSSIPGGVFQVRCTSVLRARWCRFRSSHHFLGLGVEAPTCSIVHSKCTLPLLTCLRTTIMQLITSKICGSNSQQARSALAIVTCPSTDIHTFCSERSHPESFELLLTHPAPARSADDL